VDDDELLDRLLFQLGNSRWPTASTNTSSPVGWQKLEQALRAALHDGLSPARLLNGFRSTGQPEIGTNCCKNATRIIF
jgi:hypothetical protein